MPTTVWAVQDSTKNAAKTDFGLTNEKVTYVYLNDQGAYKATVTTNFPHFINADRISYKANGKLTCIGGGQGAGIGSSYWKMPITLPLTAEQ